MQNDSQHSEFKVNQTYYGDCLEIMKIIPSYSVNLILADLPYHMIKAKWDVPIDLAKLWEQYKRIIKPNGAILMFAKTPFDKVLGCSNIDWLKYEWIWEKTQATGHYNAKKIPMQAHENILVFYKELPTYNPQKTTGHKPINTYTKRASVVNKSEVYGGVKIDISGGGETDRYPRDVLKFSSDKQKTKGTDFFHPSQKPLALCEYFIKTYTNSGDLVLDNVCGSGTTGLAAKNLGRDYVMIEKDLNYYNACKKRVQEYKNIGIDPMAEFNKQLEDISDTL